MRSTQIHCDLYWLYISGDGDSQDNRYLTSVRDAVASVATIWSWDSAGTFAQFRSRMGRDAVGSTIRSALQPGQVMLLGQPEPGSSTLLHVANEDIAGIAANIPPQLVR